MSPEAIDHMQGAAIALIAFGAATIVATVTLALLGDKDTARILLIVGATANAAGALTNAIASTVVYKRLKRQGPQ